MMPISNIASGWLRHLVYGKCAKVDIPVNPHFGWRQHWKSKFENSIYVSAPFLLKLFQIRLRKSFIVFCVMVRMGEDRKRK